MSAPLSASFLLASLDPSPGFLIGLGLLYLLAGAAVVCYLVFWCLQLAWVMARSDDQQPGRHDKWIWFGIFLFFAPLAPVVVLFCRRLHLERRARPPAPMPDLGRATARAAERERLPRLSGTRRPRRRFQRQGR